MEETGITECSCFSKTTYERQLVTIGRDSDDLLRFDANNAQFVDCVPDFGKYANDWCQSRHCQTHTGPLADFLRRWWVERINTCPKCSYLFVAEDSAFLIQNSIIVEDICRNCRRSKITKLEKLFKKDILAPFLIEYGIDCLRSSYNVCRSKFSYEEPISRCSCQLQLRITCDPTYAQRLSPRKIFE